MKTRRLTMIAFDGQKQLDCRSSENKDRLMHLRFHKLAARAEAATERGGGGLQKKKKPTLVKPSLILMADPTNRCYESELMQGETKRFRYS